MTLGCMSNAGCDAPYSSTECHLIAADKSFFSHPLLRCMSPVMPVDPAVQEFDAATNTDRAKKLTADLSHMEAEKVRLGRQSEAVKVRPNPASAFTFSLLLSHAVKPCSSGMWQLPHGLIAKLCIQA